MILKLFYRIIAPKHPRGWLDFHSVQENGKAWIHCHGMEKWNLPNIEFINVPSGLEGYAHGIAMDMLFYLKNDKLIKDGEHFGGALVHDNQLVHHLATLHEIKRNDDEIHSGLLRVVDYKCDKDSGFPFRLFAAHLISLAEVNRNQIKNLYQKAIEIFPGDECAQLDNIETPFEKGNNQNNFAAYLGLGDLFLDEGSTKNGFDYIEKAIAKCPSWAYTFSNDIREQFGKTMPEQAKQDPRFTFWNELDKNKIIEIIKKHGG